MLRKKDNSLTIGLFDIKKFNSTYEKVTQANKDILFKPKKKNKLTSYDKYIKKLDDGDIDKFTARDIYYFFRDTARQYNPNYYDLGEHISIRHLKLALERGLTPRKMLNIIAFIFESEQNYVDRLKTTPNIFNTNYINSLLIDSEAWLNDEYKPKARFTHNKPREWNEGNNNKNTNENIKIGDWEE